MVTTILSNIEDTTPVQSFEPGQTVVAQVTFESVGGVAVLEKSSTSIRDGFVLVTTISDENRLEHYNDAGRAWFRMRCVSLTEGETLSVALSEKFEDITVLEKDQNGLITTAKCLLADVPTVSGFAKGCALLITDGTHESNTLLFNIGTEAVSSFRPIGNTGAKFKLTESGGFAVKLTNKTGGASVKGEVVTVYTATAINNAVAKIVVDIPAPIGAFLESGIADGSEAWVVISGIADVYFVGNTSRGHLARGFITADGASYVSGQALSEAVPTTPFATDKHFYEIGHVLESRTGAGLAKVNLHFN